ncbi:predicted protein [Naegleria gruberi]|uniref:Predicted protein n=1 Tax=Naegleria gruberi TaxID=5762 RepID=D2VL53_NAEGR|nr:uncharacterized protein NAEGRDRAFT_69665 [Naegleria gruberi]EFC42481.1 predicted protein [Naegleria gruberi]|eukprot:XP_002675225.1 predicted protein [Naegleria gruberi strain NEG-M]
MMRFRASVKLLNRFVSDYTSTKYLSEETELLCKIVANSTLGNYKKLENDWKLIQQHPTKSRMLSMMAIELISMNFCFVGFPKVLNSLSTLKSISTKSHDNQKPFFTEDEWLELTKLSDSDSFHQDRIKRQHLGEQTMKKIYGESNYSKLAAKFKTLHPLVNQNIHMNAYGMVLQDRSHVFLAMRELSSVVSLCYFVDTCGPQLVAHMKGFTRVYDEKELGYSIPLMNPHVIETESRAKLCLKGVFELTSEMYGLKEPLNEMWQSLETSNKKYTL